MSDIIQSSFLENDHRGPELKLGDFSGPLDLLLFLIEKNEIDIFDIPIASLTNQYLEYLAELEDIDLNDVADFLLVGADLVQIKSKMILPHENKPGSDEDPRDELVWKLLLYRRAKYIAEELQEREVRYSGVYFRERLTNKEIGIADPEPEELFVDETEFQSINFDKARDNLLERNTSRYQDLSEKINYIVQRKHLSILDQINKLNTELNVKDNVNFNKMYAEAESKAEVLTGFLAMLELLKNNEVDVYQKETFADIILQRRIDKQANTGSNQNISKENSDEQ